MRRPAASAVIAVAVAACSGSPTTTDDAPPDPSPSESVVRCPSFATDCDEVLPTNTVELRGILFRPKDLEVPSGATVTFVNLDPVDHTVTEGAPGQGAPAFDLVLAEEGDEATATFDEIGVVEYFCRIHPDTMRATVRVTG